jgi:hypothetical protein
MRLELMKAEEERRKADSLFRAGAVVEFEFIDFFSIALRNL